MWWTHAAPIPHGCAVPHPCGIHFLGVWGPVQLHMPTLPAPRLNCCHSWANYLRQHVCVNCECQDPDAELCQVHLPSALRVAACVTPEDVAKHELPGKS